MNDVFFAVLIYGIIPGGVGVYGGGIHRNVHGTAAVVGDHHALAVGDGLPHKGGQLGHLGKGGGFVVLNDGQDGVKLAGAVSAGILHAEDHAGLAVGAGHEGVGVLDVHAVACQNGDHLGQTTRLVGDLHGGDVADVDQVAGFAEGVGSLGVALDDHAHDAELLGIGNGHGAHIHARLGQDVDQLLQRAGLIGYEYRNLLQCHCTVSSCYGDRESPCHTNSLVESFGDS